MRFSTDAHTARLRHALSCAGSLLLLLGVSQEVAKKETKVFPLGSPLALPLFTSRLAPRHTSIACSLNASISLLCEQRVKARPQGSRPTERISRHIATTSGRYGK